MISEPVWTLWKREEPPHLARIEHWFPIHPLYRSSYLNSRIDSLVSIVLMYLSESRTDGHAWRCTPLHVVRYEV
jgi:hypothetical protein